MRTHMHTKERCCSLSVSGTMSAIHEGKAILPRSVLHLRCSPDEPADVFGSARQVTEMEDSLRELFCDLAGTLQMGDGMAVDCRMIKNKLRNDKSETLSYSFIMFYPRSSMYADVVYVVSGFCDSLLNQQANIPPYDSFPASTPSK